MGKVKKYIGNMIRKKQIIVGYGCVTRLAKDCNTTRQSVRNALRGLVNSDDADLIRKRAKEAPYYGVEVKY